MNWCRSFPNSVSSATRMHLANLCKQCRMRDNEHPLLSCLTTLPLYAHTLPKVRNKLPLYAQDIDRIPCFWLLVFRFKRVNVRMRQVCCAFEREDDGPNRSGAPADGAPAKEKGTWSSLGRTLNMGQAHIFTHQSLRYPKGQLNMNTSSE